MAISCVLNNYNKTCIVETNDVIGLNDIPQTSSFNVNLHTTDIITQWAKHIGYFVRGMYMGLYEGKSWLLSLSIYLSNFSQCWSVSMYDCFPSWWEASSYVSVRWNAEWNMMSFMYHLQCSNMHKHRFEALDVGLFICEIWRHLLYIIIPLHVDLC